MSYYKSKTIWQRWYCTRHYMLKPSLSHLRCVIVTVYSIHWHRLVECGLVQTGSVFQMENMLDKKNRSAGVHQICCAPTELPLVYLAAESCAWVSVSDCATSAGGGVGGRRALSSSSRLLWNSCSSSWKTGTQMCYLNLITDGKRFHCLHYVHSVSTRPLLNKPCCTQVH